MPAPAQCVRGDAQEDKAGVAIGVVEGDMLRCPGYNDFGAVERKAGEGVVIAGEYIAKGGLGGDAGAADLRLGIERRGQVGDAFNGRVQQQQRDGGAFEFGIDRREREGVSLLSGEGRDSQAAYADQYPSDIEHDRLQYRLTVAHGGIAASRAGGRREIV